MLAHSDRVHAEAFGTGPTRPAGSDHPVNLGGLADPGRVKTLPELLVGWARDCGSREALTFLDHDSEPLGNARTLTWPDLQQRVSSVASVLRSGTRPGERAVLLIEQSPDYIVAYLAALHAGLVAVPLYLPDSPGRASRIASAVVDSMPSVALTTRADSDRIRAYLRGFKPRMGRIVEVDDVPDLGAGTAPVPARPQDLAHVQYASGSTRLPAGIMITHANLLANARQAAAACGVTGADLASTPGAAVSWLPLFHDMGLTLAVSLPLLAGWESVLMDPAAFRERPGRWLWALAKAHSPVSAAPNSAYRLCAERVSEEEKSDLRLDHVRCLIDGSERVRPGTLDEFDAAFSCCGFRPEMYRSSYGLAEATALVTATDGPPRQLALDRDELSHGRAVMAERAGAARSVLASSGRPIGQRLCIVDPGSRVRVAEGAVGEIWVSGANVGRGYWQRFQSSAETFCAMLHDGGLGDEPSWWLRTGDLGFVYGGELFVTGRLTDLIVVGGARHHPQDVETTVEQAHPTIRPHGVAVFSVPGTVRDRVVVVAERTKWTTGGASDTGEVIEAVRATVCGEHGFDPDEVIIVAADRIPRTTSRKIARPHCRSRYLSGAFTR